MAIASGGYGDASALLLPWGNQKEKLYYYSSPTPGFENQTTAQRILRDWDVNTVITSLTFKVQILNQIQ